MKNFILIFSVVILSANSVNAQWWSNSTKVTGNKDVKQQTRTVDNYDRVAVTGMMDVQLVAGKEGKIDLEAESNLLEYLETEVSNGQLKISVRKGVNLEPSRNYPIKITVPFEDLDAVTLTGSGHIKNSDVIRAENFKLTVTGSGNMNLNLEVEDLEGTVTGSGDVKLKGRARTLDCTVTGSGDFLAYDLKTEMVKASVTGSGDIEVSVESELAARISGSGDIKYRGNPDKQNFKTSGSGSVSKS
ncbi:DUF2807 domain-containing protein [Antarcticibacterium sp. 1MA-6-2]|uniref:head GIN domain-containing protein n=1 Tax=Antarcticibacterium sp. 1MA-6-2 TaxID=2908210 RepID=UPI001F31F814|nr:head GIN domain-containing protein [Antarcticibacterium sp. 1MA-6-2]UJH91490.1 DUF2807 domain-containing protein [Antarcticibacterium sp. 1MA-6-2]